MSSPATGAFDARDLLEIVNCDTSTPSHQHFPTPSPAPSARAFPVVLDKAMSCRLESMLMAARISGNSS